MDTSKKIIRGVVNSRGFTITSPITQWDYGWQFVPEIDDLPATYRLDFSNEEKHGTALPVYCSTEGAEVPTELIDTGKDIWVWFVRIGDGYGITEYKWRIPNKCKPKTEQDEPTPSQQSSIDQLIVRSNEAVETAEQKAEDADQSAQTAQEYAEQAETAKTNAQTYANNAQTSANNASASASQASASATASAQSAIEAQSASTNAETYALNSGNKAVESAQSAQASANSATFAQGYAQSASASAQSASGYASHAQTSANTASAKAQDASGYAQTASQKATESAQSASQALTYKTDAESAKTASQTAQGLAESARDSAITAKTDAEQAKADAESARDEAVQAVASISGALDDKADVITDTASGAVASFPDGADNLPLKSLVVDINPVQDLHGYDSPWVAGGGANKWDELTESGSINTTTGENIPHSTIIRTASYVPVIAGNTYKFVTTDQMWVFFYDSEKTLITSGLPSGAGSANNARNFRNGYTVLIPENCAYIRWYFRSEYGNTYKNDTALNYPSTVTTYSPYENICPINGWTGMNISASGKNLLDLTKYTDAPLVDCYLANGTSQKRKGFSLHFPNGTYKFTCKNPDNGAYIYLNRMSKDNALLGFSYIITGTNVSSPVTTLTNGEYIIIFDQQADREQAQPKFGAVNIQIEVGSVSTGYEPYQGQSIPINWQTEAGTVYGGKLDVLSGVLTVDRYFGTSANGTSNVGISQSDDGYFWHNTTSGFGIPSIKGTNAKLVTDRFKPVSGIAHSSPDGVFTFYANNIIRWKEQGGMTLNEYKAYLAENPFTLCYEIVEPIEIQLTPHEVNSLLGQNNIFADTGDSEVEYRADTKLYINKKIAEALASLT